MFPSEHKKLKIAKVLKSNGTEGHVIISFLGISPEDIDIEDPVFIYFDGLPVPFFFDSFERKGQAKAVVRMTGIRTLADADDLAGAEIYADEENLDIAPDEGDFSFLEGWTLADASGIAVGTVSSFMDIPGNPCLEILSEGQKILIPLHEDLIAGIDEEGRTLCMSIPDGLIPDRK